MSGDPARAQFPRYVVVALPADALRYSIYVVLTCIGIEPKLAMTLLCGGRYQ
jgi:hypothetical protein